jgi:hypothetical protein
LKIPDIQLLANEVREKMGIQETVGEGNYPYATVFTTACNTVAGVTHIIFLNRLQKFNRMTSVAATAEIADSII